MYPNAGASQRAQGRSPGLGGRGTHRRGVAPGAVASLPAGCRRPEAGRSHRTATRMEIRWVIYLYILSGLSGPGLGRRSARAAAFSAHGGRTSDCGSQPCLRRLRLSLGAEIHIYTYMYVYYGLLGRAGAGGALGRLPRAHSGSTSDCGGTSDDIVYVCALVSHSRCKRGLPRRVEL